MNNTQPNRSRFGIVLSGALLAAAAFAVPGMFKGQKEVEVAESYYPAVPLQAAPSAPEVSSSSGSTTLYIQNKETVAGSVYVTFYQDNGVAIEITSCLVGAAGVTNTIAANDNLILDYAGCAPMSAGSRGSTVVSSDVDVAVVSVNRYSPNNASSGNIGISSGDSVLSVANLRRNFSNQVDSSLFIQNTDAVTKSARVDFYSDSFAGVIASKYITLPAFSSSELNLGSTTDAFFTGNPSFNPVGGYRGSAIVNATDSGHFAATADLRRNASGLGVTGIYTNELLHSTNAVGSSSLATVYYAPFVRKNIIVPPNTTGFVSDIQMANPNGIIANVTISLTISKPYTWFTTFTLTVPANNSYVWATANPIPAPTLPTTLTASWEGSAVIASNQPLAVQVRDSKLAGATSRGTSTGYNALTDSLAGNTLFAPVVKRNVGSVTQRTNLRVQNIGSASTFVRVEYVAGPGSPSLTINQSVDYLTVALQPGEAINFVQFSPFRKDNTTVLPDGFFGAAKIIAVTSSGGSTIDASAKIIATINETSADIGSPSNWLDAQQYEAIK